MTVTLEDLEVTTNALREELTGIVARIEDLEQSYSNRLLKRGKMHGRELSDEEAQEWRIKLGIGSERYWLAEIKKRPPGHWSSADCEYAISRVEALEAEVELHRRKAKDEYWCWQGDGEDYPESLTCPVLISIEDLRALLPVPEKTRAIPVPVECAHEWENMGTFLMCTKCSLQREVE